MIFLHGFGVTPNGIVDVSGPHTREKQQKHVHKVVHWHEKETHNVRGSLRTVKRINKELN